LPRYDRSWLRYEFEPNPKKKQPVLPDLLNWAPRQKRPHFCVISCLIEDNHESKHRHHQDKLDDTARGSHRGNRIFRAAPHQPV
jgi:hypothetical protein